MAKLIDLSEFVPGSKRLWIDVDKAITIMCLDNNLVRFIFSSMTVRIIFHKNSPRADEFVEYVLSGKTDMSIFKDSIRRIKVLHALIIGINIR